MELDISRIDGLKLRRDVSVSPFTSIGTGGRIRYLADIEEAGALAELVRRLKQGGVSTARTFILGKGTNLLVSDEGFEGVVVRLGGEFDAVRVEEGRLVGGAAATLAALLEAARDNGLGGLEFMSGIPGSIGGAVAMNAGAWGKAIWDFASCVRGINSEGNEDTLDPLRHRTAYRQGNLPRGFIVTETVLVCEPSTPGDITQRIAEVLAKRRKIKAEEVRTFGSVFKNPEGHFAGRLLEAVDVKGMSSGDAMISKDHANFIFNRGNATSRDVLELMRTMRKRVMEKFGIELVPEVVLLGFRDGALEE